MLRALKAFRSGVSFTNHQHSADQATVRMPIPEKVVIPMLTHTGAPCEPLVKKGDRVKRGQLIAISSEDQVAAVHASVSGEVVAIGPNLYEAGRNIRSVVIHSEHEQLDDPSIEAIQSRDPDEMIEALRQSGIVDEGGLGGQSQSIWHKLIKARQVTIDKLIVNGAECEPYVTSDFREMVENPDGILKGINAVLHMVGIPEAIIAIEASQKEGIAVLDSHCQSETTIEVMKVAGRYPHAAEMHLIHSTTGRLLEAGASADSASVLLLNVSTVAAISRFFETGMPLVERRISVAGAALHQSSHLIVPIGTLLKDLIEFVGGFKLPVAQLIMGGPLRGLGQFTLDSPVVRHTEAVIAFTEDEIDHAEESACIRCGRCVQVCPMNLLPLDMNTRILQGEVEVARDKYNLMDCIECGACSYSCPAARNLVQSFRLGKAAVQAQKPRGERIATKGGE